MNRSGVGIVWVDDVDCVVVFVNVCGGEGIFVLCWKLGCKVINLRYCIYVKLYWWIFLLFIGFVK